MLDFDMQKAFGTKLNFSSLYHYKTDGQTERVNKILEDMLTSKESGKIIYHWWNSPLIVATNPTLR